MVLRTASRALKVPLGALVRRDAGWAVFVVAQGHARLKPVKVGAMTDREAEVTDGPQRGEQVVVFPSDRVRDGARVSARSRAAA